MVTSCDFERSAGIKSRNWKKTIWYVSWSISQIPVGKGASGSSMAKTSEMSHSMVNHESTDTNGMIFNQSII